MNCIITQLNHIFTIPSVLSRREGWMDNNHQNVCAPTNLEQLRLRRIWHLPTLYSETETPPSQLESLSDSVEIHFTELLLLYQSFAFITSLFLLPWKLLIKHKVIFHSTLPTKRKCKSYSQQNCCSWFLIAVSDSAKWAKSWDCVKLTWLQRSKKSCQWSVLMATEISCAQLKQESIEFFPPNSYLSHKDLNVHDQKQAELHFSLECPWPSTTAQ